MTWKTNRKTQRKFKTSDATRERARRSYYENIERNLQHSRKWRAEHPKEVKEYQDQYRKVHAGEAKQYQRERREEFRMWKGFAGPCLICGNSDVRVLEFHHRDPKRKKFEIGSNNWFTVTLTDLIEELRKCDVLCANCHRVREFEKRN